MKIQVLLSTYNGEKYIRAQLDSFLSLRNRDSVAFLIRDDGSSDGTLSILREYENQYGFKVISGENIGLNGSINELLLNRDKDCDFYAFSDQDDVWLPEKLERAISFLDKLPKNQPCLYAGTSFITDDELNVKGKTRAPRKELTFYNAMVENICIGHTMVINEALAKLFTSSFNDKIFVFDYWCAMIALAFGKVVFDTEPTALYRQHGSNAIGYKRSALAALPGRIKRSLSGRSNKNALQLKGFLEKFSETAPKEYVRESERFFAMSGNFFKRLAYVFSTKCYRQGFGEGVIFRLMYLFGKYNLK